jgi:hypothetical protein
MIRVAAVLGALTLVLAGCGDDDETPTTTTDVEVTIGQGLRIGATYEDPSGNVTITVSGIRVLGDLLLANAEACAAEDSPPGLPIQENAWQLRVRGGEEAIPRILLEDPNRAASPPWPDNVSLEPGRCFDGKVAFRLPEAGARPTTIIFTQLSQPVAWRIRN